MDDICKNYFQKSRIFLYPALKIPRKSSIIPIDTYLTWEGNYSLNDNKLLCVYYTRDDVEFKTFEKKYLLDNELFVRCHTLTPDISVYIFDFSKYKHEYKCVTEGRYSKMGLDYKKSLMEYHKPTDEATTTVSTYLLSYLYPHNWYALYAEFLLMNENVLKETVELCDKPDLIKENFVVSQKSPKIVKLSSY